MVEKDRRKQEDEKDIRSALRIEKVREEAEFGIRFGLQSDTKSPVNIVSIEERPNSQFSAMFAHNLNLERSQMGGLAMLWVLIPKTEEPPASTERGESLDRLRKLRRTDGDEDPSRN